MSLVSDREILDTRPCELCIDLVERLRSAENAMKTAQQDLGTSSLAWKIIDEHFQKVGE